MEMMSSRVAKRYVVFFYYLEGGGGGGEGKVELSRLLWIACMGRG